MLKTKRSRTIAMLHPKLSALWQAVLVVIVLAMIYAVTPATIATASSTTPKGKLAAKPLYRDPVMDGAADPTVIWSSTYKKWFMFYTSRRANVPGLGRGVAWVYGTPIGIATSDNGGATWKYLRNADIIYKAAVSHPTYWAPAVVEHNGLYHMFVTYVPGIFNNWSGPRYIIHLTSTDLIHWHYVSTLPLANPKVIDPGLLHLPNGSWRLWYKDEATGSSCDYADSPDLYHWKNHGRVPGLSDVPGEAPLAFHWKGRYWLFRDIGNALALYRSADALHWKRVGTMLRHAGTGAGDKGVGHHPDVILSRGRAYLFYFVQHNRRSCIQVTQLKYHAGKDVLTVNRNAPTYIDLLPPRNPETESKFEPPGMIPSPPRNGR